MGRMNLPVPRNPIEQNDFQFIRAEGSRSWEAFYKKFNIDKTRPNWQAEMKELIKSMKKAKQAELDASIKAQGEQAQKMWREFLKKQVEPLAKMVQVVLIDEIVSLRRRLKQEDHLPIPPADPNPKPKCLPRGFSTDSGGVFHRYPKYKMVKYDANAVHDWAEQVLDLMIEKHDPISRVGFFDSHVRLMGAHQENYAVNPGDLKNLNAMDPSRRGQREKVWFPAIRITAEKLRVSFDAIEVSIMASNVGLIDFEVPITEDVHLSEVIINDWVTQCKEAFLQLLLPEELKDAKI